MDILKQREKLISKLQYIGSASKNASQLQMIRAICEAGGKWIQLRLKDETEAEILEIAKEVRKICDEYNAIFILNDYPEIALKAKADGVHLGKLDTAHEKARSILGKDFIIGGTANTMEDIRHYATIGVIDYIGLGPFRFTQTKKNLSPILGLEGYKQIIQTCQKEAIHLPIVAIGGIRLDDIADIMETGVHGIAVSGLLTNADDKKTILAEIKYTVT